MISKDDTYDKERRNILTSKIYCALLTHRREYNKQNELQARSNLPHRSPKGERQTFPTPPTNRGGERDLRNHTPEQSKIFPRQPNIPALKQDPTRSRGHNLYKRRTRRRRSIRTPGRAGRGERRREHSASRKKEGTHVCSRMRPAAAPR